MLRLKSKLEQMIHSRTVEMNKWPLPAQLIKSRVYRSETSDLNVSRDPEEPL